MDDMLRPMMSIMIMLILVGVISSLVVGGTPANGGEQPLEVGFASVNFRFI